MDRRHDPAGRSGGDGGPSAGSYLGVGLQFALSIVLFVYLGQWLDRRFGTEPWMLLLGLLVGAGGSFYSIYRKLMADLRREEERKKE
jgi:F0F1-type ATP synthase assembly protein I